MSGRLYGEQPAMVQAAAGMGRLLLKLDINPHTGRCTEIADIFDFRPLYGKVSLLKS